MDEKIQPYSEEHIYVICDLIVPLNMYRLDEPFISRITAKFPNINLIFTSPETIFDDANQNPLFKKATIYLGNLFSMEYIKLIPGLKWIHLCSVGRDKVNEELVKEKNISVTSSGGIPNNPMVASAITVRVQSLFKALLRIFDITTCFITLRGSPLCVCSPGSRITASSFVFIETFHLYLFSILQRHVTEPSPFCLLRI